MRRFLVVVAVVLFLPILIWEARHPDDPSVNVRPGQQIKLAVPAWWYPRKVSVIPYACPTPKPTDTQVVCTICNATDRTHFDCSKQ